MAIKMMDLKGLKCPQPTLKLTIEVNRGNIQKGDIIEAVADCPTFATDIKNWCDRMHKTLIWIKEEGGGAKRCQIQG